LKLTILNNNFKLFQNKEDLQINELIEFNLLNLFQEHDRYFNSKPKDLKKAIEEGKGFSIREIFNHQDYFEIFNDFDNFLEKIKINQKKDKLPKKDHFEERNFNYLDSEYFPFFLKYMGITDEKSIFLLGGDS
jgi:hypothetical protein